MFVKVERSLKEAEKRSSIDLNNKEVKKE